MSSKRIHIPGASDPDEDGRGIVELSGFADLDEDLPFTVELWDLPRREVERVLARAAGATLAHAIFLAAQGEHVGRRISLRRGRQLIAEST
jgi:hypothetical protein